MFDWSRGSTLKAMMKAAIPGVEADDWLEGWMNGFIQIRFKLQPPLEVLDVTLGDGQRPYRTSFEQQGASLSTIAADEFLNRQLPTTHEKRYDLVTLFSLEQENCLAPLDLDRPLVLLDRLLTAANLLKPGGALIWSHLYCFSSSPDDVHAFLEPGAVYQAVRRRNFRPFNNDYLGTDRVTILNSSDTLFVRHKTVLAASDRHHRIVRVIAGVSRHGANCRVTYS